MTPELLRTREPASYNMRTATRLYLGNNTRALVNDFE